MEAITTAFILTTFAGLSTGIGSLIAFFIPKPKLTYLSVLLGFAAGAMLYISFVELLSASIENVGFLTANIAFFFGIIVIYFLDRIVTHVHVDTLPDRPQARLKKAGIFTAIGIAMHNFPEGMAVLITSLSDLHLGLPIAVAIAIHNIPEGITVSVPIYYATENRKKAFVYSFLSGLSEPVGAAFGYLLIYQFLTATLLDIILAAVGGIMVFICFDELLPIAIKYGDEHLMISGLLSGMAVMAVSLYLFG
ncbi:zinc transporter ZupT [uncultured Methanolobus sp.]|uniref:zinc transporter ZupT n=1 Tax=uncultured Methanolobus sp. TaxID=218300 RepID=UPI0029C899B7|nr:zinc transporter ZupT [uncultured Methanolobus sp.]